jgi:hypothetical protein
MSNHVRWSFGHVVVVFLLVLFIVFPHSVTLAQCTNCSPWVVNTGASCFFPSPFNDPTLGWNRCSPLQYDFDVCSGSGNPCYFQLLSGPGVIDSVTGVWTWSDIPASAVGHDFVVRIQAVEPIADGPSAPVTMTVTITNTPPVIASGCQLTTTLTGAEAQTQMTIAPAECDPVYWEATQIMGSNSAVYGIDGTGVLSFTAADPGLYLLQVVVSDSAAADTCDHTYLVHGGGNCCTGRRGNVNNFGITDLSDLALLVAYLTSPYTVLPCYESANVNGVGIVDIADLSSLVSYLIGGGYPLPACP